LTVVVEHEGKGLAIDKEAGIGLAAEEVEG
jgi:hypothetical protein